MLYTSSWFTKLPDTVHRIGISRGTPRGQPGGYSMMRELAPGPWFNSISAEEYFRRYSEQLAELDPQAIVDKIHRLAGGAGNVPPGGGPSGGKDAALLCFEPPHDPARTCHRAYVSAWLLDTLGLIVREFSDPHAAFGWAHPKLPRLEPPELLRSPSWRREGP
jgi:hypothetical protein